MASDAFGMCQVGELQVPGTELTDAEMPNRQLWAVEVSVHDS